MNKIPSYFELYSRSLEKYRDEVVVEDSFGTHTMASIEIYSARVLAYLREYEIGTNDRVLIILPRGFKTLVAMLGVLKAGAVFIPLEEGYPEDRVDYIRNDCQPKLVIDSLAYDKIVAMESYPGRSDVEPHDLAFILYTSGSTGNPKGVMHEYGSLDYMVETYAKYYETESPELSYLEVLDNSHGQSRGCCASPSYFIAGITYYLDVICTGNYCYFMNPSDFNDPAIFKGILYEKKLTSVFLTPSYLKTFDDIKTPYLEEVYVGAERVAEVFDEGVKFCNCYGMTESVCPITYFYIDKEYESTPIGKPYENLQVHLIGEDGKEVEKGNMGEIIFYNPYFRGYYNLPEQTAAVKKSNWYYSGDMARELPDGNLVIFGRKDDMIKVHGNRIEPGEVETALKELLHIDWVHVQSFQVRNKAFICAYYLDDIEFDVDELKAALSKMLPSYMIPNFYIQIDEIPKLPSGKIDRMAFTAPEIDRLKTEYIQPRTETETMFCQLVEKVLDISPVGINDDFYVLGGDSLSAMEMVSEIDLPGFDVSHIARYKIIEKIAKRYDEIKEKASKSLDVRSEENKQKAWQILPHQFMFLKQQEFHPESMEYNLSFILKFNRFTNTKKLKNAVDMVIHNHPALFTIFFRDTDGSIRQKYDPSIEKKITIENISEDAFLKMKDSLPQPFVVDSSRLYDCRIFKTMKNTYVFFDVHHSISDGVSLSILINNISKAYRGEKLEPDYFYAALEDYHDALESEDIRECKAFYEDRYKDFCIPQIAKKEFSDEGSEDTIYSDIDVPRRKILKCLKTFDITDSELYMGVLGVAIAKAAKQKQFGFGWTYSGRDSVVKNNSCSCYITQLLTYLDFDKTPTLDAYYADIKRQVNENIQHVMYPYAFTILPKYQGALTYIYQGGIFNTDKKAIYEFVPIENQKNASDTFLNVNLFEENDSVSIVFGYNTAYFDSQLIHQIMLDFGAALRRIVDCNAPEKANIKELLNI